MNSLRINGARVEVWRDVGEISERAAELVIGIAREAAGRGEFTLALSGGSTPRALYELLATEEKSARVPWEQTQVFWSDERCVPPDDAESNYRLAHEALLSRVPVPAEHVHRMRGEDEPGAAAAAYAGELEKNVGAGDPRLSLILLGMGEDGHTASLFPQTDALKDTVHTVAANYVEKLKSHRLTMTLRTLNAAATVIFLVSGAAKSEALSKVFESDAVADGSLPARLVRPAQGELIWLVDEDAARLVTNKY
ncbi:MAG: 6-phosphogluconolactonase [Acidobacteria bacterium]|nr:6-phosphogluconolactonase [Acidobacteriota bacterium]